MTRSNGLPYSRKASNAEVAARTEEVASMIAIGLTTSQIAKIVHDKYGLSERSIGMYMRRAKEYIRRAARTAREELRGRMMVFYETVMRGKERTADRLRAAAQLCELMGLNAPAEQLVGGIAGQPIETSDASIPTVLVLPEQVLEDVRAGAPLPIGGHGGEQTRN